MSNEEKKKELLATYMGNQLYSMAYPASGSADFYVDSVIPVDRIRISLYDALLIEPNFTPCITVYSNLIDNYIGTIGCDFNYEGNDGVNDFYVMGSSLQPRNGVNIFLRNRIRLYGNYRLDFRFLDGTIPTGVDGSVFIYIEYFIDG